jgi:hypothetical protein
MDVSKMNKESEFFFFHGDVLTGQEIFKIFAKEVDEKLVYNKHDDIYDVTKNIDTLIGLIFRDDPDNLIMEVPAGVIINLIDRTVFDAYEIYDRFTKKGKFRVVEDDETTFFNDETKQFNKDFSDIEDLLDNINHKYPEKYDFKLIWYGPHPTKTKKQVISSASYLKKDKNSNKSTFYHFEDGISSGEEIYKLLTKEVDGKFSYEDSNGYIYDVTENIDKFIALLCNDHRTQPFFLPQVGSEIVVNAIDKTVFHAYEIFKRFTDGYRVFKDPGSDIERRFKRDLSDFEELLEAINQTDPEKYDFKYVR